MIIQHPKPSPVMIVGLIAFFFFAAFIVASYLKFRTKTVDPRVTMESKERMLGKQLPAQQTAIPTLIDGEVARTADRIGEAAAVALSACLYAAGEQTRGRTPRTVRDLLGGVAARNLIPPGLTLIQAEGVLASTHGTLSVRYRPLPLGIEVISIGNKPEYGPALIARVPDELSDKVEATLFIANSLAGVNIPGPFAPAAEVIALGWSPEQWRSLR